MAINPNTWRTLKLSDPHQQQVFVDQLVQHLNDQFTKVNTQLNATNIAAADTTQNIGAISTANYTLNANSAKSVAFTFTFSAPLTFHIINLVVPATVVFTGTNTGGAGEVFGMTASTPAGTAYTSITVTASSQIDLLFSGWLFAAGATHTANGSTLAASAPSLTMVGQ